MRGHTSRRGGAAPQHRTALLVQNPTHPPTTLAVQAAPELNFNVHIHGLDLQPA
ncbi:hypothetical protein [uncultured Campylobacter sp.]|uniref:hypothetical protein n=1 Tax=uncultured Campylobacter sp. TaxID=218934 RepID=UPI002608DB2D|nr:hypothetical protein [uncultured Campylobacter sp.]